MKKAIFYTMFAAMPMVYSCSQNADKTNEKAAEAANLDSLSVKECFMAVDAKDTADLKIKTLKDGSVTGNFVIKYEETGTNDGVLKGKFSGDTLFVDYTFKVGTKNPTIYKNPLAFLRQGKKMILGVGQIETSMGKSYFVKEKPIRFDKSKFIFNTVECTEK
jgi:hypothetical protein